MPMSSKIFLPLLAALFWMFQPAFAQQRPYDIMVEEGGKPIQRPPASVVPSDGEVKKQPKQPRQRTYRGSSYVPPANLPRTEAIVTPQAPGVYTPPPINSFSDRVTKCNHSFPLNAGIGNNPSDRSSYVRQCAN
jgi:hypothetical protein